VKRLSLFVLFMAIFSLASCYKKKTSSTAVTCTTTAASTSSASSSVSCTDPVTGISVAISPATVSVNIVTTTQFLGFTSGGTNSIIIWKVNNIPKGNDTVGTIDANGLYSAPTSVPSPATVTVSATSFEDMNLTASSTVTITPPPVVTISPTSWTMSSGTANTKTFTSTVTGAATTNVDWYVEGAGTSPVPGGNDVLGRIDANGVYSAPRTPPPGSNVNVIAVSRDFTLSFARAAVTISGYSPSSLQGQFAFSLSGQNASASFFRAGTFTADGAGNLNSGLEDINEASGVTTGLSFVGTYTVASDGRGTLLFNDGPTPTTLDFVLVNGTQLQIIGSASTGTASGQANMRDATAFTASAFSQTYVFDFAGVRGSNGLSQIGEFKSDGAGNITSGLIDTNDGGSLSQVSVTGGTYSVSPSSGRGTITLVTSTGTLTFSFYVVSHGSAIFVGTDTTQRVAGMASQQDPNAIFDKTSLSGNFAFLLSNSGSGGTYASAGSFSADGNGGIASGVLDENSNGTPNSNVAFNGTYTVTANGRGTATFTGTRTYVFYLGASGNAVFQETDSVHPNIASDGILAKQQSAAFSQSLISGNYAISSSGLSGSTVETIAGEMAADGAGNIGAGILDINTGGTLTTGQTITGAYPGPFLAERGTFTLNFLSPLIQTRNFAVYSVSPKQAFVVEIDAGRLAAGTLLLQF